MKKLTVSIDKQSKSYAVFEGVFNLVKPFTKYEQETVAQKEAATWVTANYGEDSTIEFVYPVIKKMRIG